MDLAVSRDASTATGAEDDREDHLRASGRTVGGLGDGEAVGVVGAADGTGQGSRKVMLQRLAVEPGGVCILHQTSGADNGAWNSDAHRGGTAAADALLQLSHHVSDRLHRGGIVMLRGSNAQAGHLRAVRVQRESLNLCPAEVDSDANSFCHGSP